MLHYDVIPIIHAIGVGGSCPIVLIAMAIVTVGISMPRLMMIPVTVNKGQRSQRAVTHAQIQHMKTSTVCLSSTLLICLTLNIEYKYALYIVKS